MFWQTFYRLDAISVIEPTEELDRKDQERKLTSSRNMKLVYRYRAV